MEISSRVENCKWRFVDSDRLQRR